MLGLESCHADVLAQILYESLPRAEAVQGIGDDYGDRWTSHHEVIGLNGKGAIVSAGWIYRSHARNVPSLVTCYIDTGLPDELRKLLDLT